MKRNITTVLFDLDGTLLDTAPQFLPLLNQMLAEHDRPATALKAFRSQVAFGSRAMVKAAFGQHTPPPLLDTLEKTLVTRYRENLHSHTEVFPGIEAMLAQLADHGIAWGIVTSKPGWLTEPLLAHFDFAQFASCVVSGDSTTRGKPFPDPLLLACEMMGVSAENCIYVGDAEVDMMAGKQANMHTLLASYGYSGEGVDLSTWQATGIIQHPSDIIDWVRA